MKIIGIIKNKIFQWKYKRGKIITLADWLKENPCPFIDFCNYSKDCEDDDWINCGTFNKIENEIDIITKKR